jgi:hypothetical protein
MRSLIRAAKDKPCADCGVRYPYYVMDFDHREGEEKLANVGYFAFSTEAALGEEVAKCDVVCANCHRIRTWRRRRASDE